MLGELFLIIQAYGMKHVGLVTISHGKLYSFSWRNKSKLGRISRPKSAFPSSLHQRKRTFLKFQPIEALSGDLPMYALWTAMDDTKPSNVLRKATAINSRQCQAFQRAAVLRLLPGASPASRTERRGSRRR